MNRLILTIIFLASLTINAQDKPKVGDKLTINAPIGQSYNHIAFPKKNFIAKRGKVANYKSLYGNAVVIKELITNKKGDTYVILEKQDGKKFFGFLTKVKANYKAAVESGELSTIKS
ncbi:hypothetical protein [Aestuariivivens sp. NBU2969]|uniref:hypothetical protein n=1 Tax=Aestuariivivens sp. NBU2969 TaxID=2873267 RepID=UPI001CBF0731|nr:hypothetical protein [Aestuariivivens sp. NBU2969]